MKNVLALGIALSMSSAGVLAQVGSAKRANPHYVQEQVTRGTAHLGERSADAEVIKARISELNRMRALAPEQRDPISILKSQWLVASGITSDKLRDMEAQGLDINGALERDISGSVIDYALLSEIVVVGRLEGVTNEDLGDGLLSTARFVIEDRVKGVVPGGSLSIRQRSGKDSQGNEVIYDSDFQANAGGRFLLFVSQGLYDIGTVQKTGRKPAKPDAYYIPQRASFEVKNNGNLEPLGQGVPVPTETLSELVARIKALKL